MAGLSSGDASMWSFAEVGKQGRLVTVARTSLSVHSLDINPKNTDSVAIGSE